MNKLFKAVLASAALNLILLYLISSDILVVHKQVDFTSTKAHQPRKKLEQKKKFNLALFAPSVCETVDQIIEGFRSVLDKSEVADYTYTIYYSNNNRTLLRSEIEDALLKNYDLMFTLGAHCTLMCKEITTKKLITTPIVFGAVDAPVEYGLIKSIENSGNHLTGAAAEKTARHYEQLDYFFELEPNIRNCVVPYNPANTHGEETEVDRIVAYMEKRGIPTYRAEIYHTNQIIEKVAPLINEKTLVFTLRDGTIMSGIEALIKFCNTHHAPLFSSDLAGVAKGAAAGFGAREQDTGIEAAHKVVKILEMGYTPSQIPVSIPPFSYRLVLNQEAMKKQQLIVNPLKFFLVQNGELIRGNDDDK